MRILIWGFGNYYHKKADGFSKEQILAFVSSKESGQFEGIDIISPEELLRSSYDKLYLMVGTNAVFEILAELRHLDFQEWNKIVFGWTVIPYTEEEALLLKNGTFACNGEGICVYQSLDLTTDIRSQEDWNRLKQRKTRAGKKNCMADIPYEPISRFFGLDRGQAIDRYFIEKFLEECTHFIHGDVLEVSEQTYTMQFGCNIGTSYTMHVCETTGWNNIVANLETGEGVIDNLVDCFILTQTLPFIFDVRAAAENAVRFLKDGGTMLVTVPGITQISRYDMDRWGHYWSFTTASLKRLFKGCRDVESVEVKAYGNVRTVISGLYGLAVEDMKQEDFLKQDDDYQQIITAVVSKKIR